MNYQWFLDDQLPPAGEIVRLVLTSDAVSRESLRHDGKPVEVLRSDESEIGCALVCLPTVDTTSSMWLDTFNSLQFWPIVDERVENVRIALLNGDDYIEPRSAMKIAIRAVDGAFDGVGDGVCDCAHDEESDDSMDAMVDLINMLFDADETHEDEEEEDERDFPLTGRYYVLL
jgi:hypothetical protein